MPSLCLLAVIKVLLASSTPPPIGNVTALEPTDGTSSTRSCEPVFGISIKPDLCLL